MDDNHDNTSFNEVEENQLSKDDLKVHKRVVVPYEGILFSGRVEEIYDEIATVTVMRKSKNFG